MSEILVLVEGEIDEDSMLDCSGTALGVDEVIVSEVSDARTDVVIDLPIAEDAEIATGVDVDAVSRSPEAVDSDVDIISVFRLTEDVMSGDVDGPPQSDEVAVASKNDDFGPIDIVRASPRRERAPERKFPPEEEELAWRLNSQVRLSGRSNSEAESKLHRRLSPRLGVEVAEAPETFAEMAGMDVAPVGVAETSKPAILTG